MSPNRVVGFLCVALAGALSALYLAFDVHFAMNNDALYFSHNKAQAMQASLRAGELPMWNPLEGAGIDQIAEGSKDFLLAPLLLVVDAKAYLALAGFAFLAGSIFAFYWFAVNVGLRPWPAAVGACVWASNGFNLWHLHELNQQSVLLWLPAVLGGLAILESHPRRARIVLVAAASASLSYGRLELTEYTYAIAVLFIWLAMPASRRVRSTITLAVSGLLGTMIVAWFLAPYFHALAASARIGQTHAPVYWPWHALLRHALPSTDAQVASRAYVSLIALPLAVVGLRRDRGLTLVAMALSALYVLFTFDTRVYPLVQSLPLHHAHWNVERFVAFGAFAFSLLTAAGLDALDPEKESPVSPAAARAMLALTLVGAVLLLVMLARMREVPRPVLVLNILQVLVTCGLISGLLISVRIRSQRLHRFVLAGAAVAALGFGFGFNRTDRNDGDLTELEGVYFGWTLGQLPSPAPVHPRRPGPFRTFDELQFHPAFRASQRTESLEYYTPFIDRRVAQYVAVLKGTQLDVAPERRGESVLARVADARVLCTRRSDLPADWERIYDNGGVFCYERRHPLLRYRFVDRVRAIAAGEDPIQTVVEMGRAQAEWFDQGIAVEGPVPAAADTFTHDNNRILAERTRFNRIDLQVEVGQPRAILTIANRFDMGWRASVDDSPVPLFRANAIFQGLVIPGGRHAVTLRYRTPFLLPGAMVSAVGFGIAVLWIRRAGRLRPSGLAANAITSDRRIPAWSSRS